MFTNSRIFKDNLRVLLHWSVASSRTQSSFWTCLELFLKKPLTVWLIISIFFRINFVASFILFFPPFQLSNNSRFPLFLRQVLSRLSQEQDLGLIFAPYPKLQKYICIEAPTATILFNNLYFACSTYLVYINFYLFLVFCTSHFNFPACVCFFCSIFLLRQFCFLISCFSYAVILLFFSYEPPSGSFFSVYLDVFCFTKSIFIARGGRERSLVFFIITR